MLLRSGGSLRPSSPEVSPPPEQRPVTLPPSGSPISATTVVWDRTTGTPLAPAIVWQDTRTDALVAELSAVGGADRFRSRCGLPLATYFSGPKVRWLLERNPRVRSAADSGEAAFGTIDSWLLWNLTGRHITDVTNASRTMLMGLDTLEWDPTLLDAIGVPAAMLPTIEPSVDVYGEGRGVLGGVTIAGDLGDQQAALFGQTAFEAGRSKNTYGTGCFLLLNTGSAPVASTHGLLTTVAYRIEGNRRCMRSRGSVAMAGAVVQWMRDNLKVIGSAAEVETLAASVEDNGGVYFVPAFSGLFAPLLAVRRPGPDHGSHPIRRRRSHRSGRAGGDGVPDGRSDPRHGGGFWSAYVDPVCRRWHGGERVADAVPGRCSWRTGGASRRQRDDRPRCGLRRRVGSWLLREPRRDPLALGRGTTLGAEDGWCAARGFARWVERGGGARCRCDPLFWPDLVVTALKEGRTGVTAPTEQARLHSLVSTVELTGRAR